MAVRRFDGAEAIELGTRLRWAREALGVTLQELAADAGIDYSSARYLEAGERMPSLPLLKILCHILRISPDYLLFGSLAGTDPAPARILKELHPELDWPPSSPTSVGTRRSSKLSIGRPPMRRATAG